MPYPPDAFGSDSFAIDEIVPCHHAPEPRGQPLGHARLIGRAHAHQHRLVWWHRLERDDRQLAEAACDLRLRRGWQPSIVQARTDDQARGA